MYIFVMHISLNILWENYISWHTHRIYLQRCKKIRQLRTLLCILIFCLTIQKRFASDPWRSFVTLFLHARRLKIPRLSSLVVMRFETVRLFTLLATSRKRLTITRAISRKLIWSGDGRLKYRKEWPFPCGKRKKRANGRYFLVLR